MHCADLYSDTTYLTIEFYADPVGMEHLHGVFCLEAELATRKRYALPTDWPIQSTFLSETQAGTTDAGYVWLRYLARLDWESPTSDEPEEMRLYRLGKDVTQWA